MFPSSRLFWKINVNGGAITSARILAGIWYLVFGQAHMLFEGSVSGEVFELLLC
jgi:hypothetical protein